MEKKGGNIISPEKEEDITQTLDKETEKRQGKLKKVVGMEVENETFLDVDMEKGKSKEWRARLD